MFDGLPLPNLELDSMTAMRRWPGIDHSLDHGFVHDHDYDRGHADDHDYAWHPVDRLGDCMILDFAVI